jgi:2'-5' RNA ligase
MSRINESIKVKDVMNHLTGLMMNGHKLEKSRMSNIKIKNQHDNSNELTITLDYDHPTSPYKSTSYTFTMPFKNGKITGTRTRNALSQGIKKMNESFNPHVARTLEKMIGKSDYSKITNGLRNMAMGTMIDDKFKDFKFAVRVSKSVPTADYNQGLVQIRNRHLNPRDRENAITIEVEIREISGIPEFRAVTMGVDSKIVQSSYERKPENALRSLQRQLPKNKGTAYMVEVDLDESFNPHVARTLEKMIGKSDYSKITNGLRNMAMGTMIDDEFKDFKFSVMASKSVPTSDYNQGLVRISNRHRNPRGRENAITIEVEIREISGIPEFRAVTLGLDSKIVQSSYERKPENALKSLQRQLPKNKGTAYMVEAIKTQAPSGDLKKMLDEYGLMSTYRSYRRGTFKTLADKGEFAAIVLEIEYFNGQAPDDITSVGLNIVGKTGMRSAKYRNTLKFNKVGEKAIHKWQTTHRPFVSSPHAPEPKAGTAYRELIVLAIANGEQS